MGAGSQEGAHSVAYSRSSKSPQGRPPQPRQYPPWARSPLKRPPPAHLRSSTTQNMCHRPPSHLIISLITLIFLISITKLLLLFFFLLLVKGVLRHLSVFSLLLFNNILLTIQTFMLGSLNKNSMEEEEKDKEEDSDRQTMIVLACGGCFYK